MAGGEKVACVDADADAGFVLRGDEGDYGGEVGEGGADEGGGTGHGFEEGGYVGGGGEGAVQSRGYAGDGGGAGSVVRPPRVEIVELDAQCFAAVEVFDEAIVGLFRLVRILLREVDEVGAVWDDVSCGVVFVLDAVCFEAVAVLVLQGRVFPFPLGFEEEGEGVSAICVIREVVPHFQGGEGRELGR